MTAKDSYDNDVITINSLRDSFLDFLILLYTSVKYIFRFFFQYKKTILLCMVLIAGIGVFLAFRTREVYSLKMIVSHNDLTKRTYAEAIEQLNKLADSKSVSQLSLNMSTSETMVRNIKALKTYNLDGDPLLTDTSNSKDLPFIITAEVYDNLIADSLQERLLNYFNGNPYLKKKKETQKKIYEEKLLFITDELAKLDSLKHQYNLFLGSSGKTAMFYNNAFNPAEIYQRSNEYQYLKETIITWLNNEYQTIKLIEGFKPSLKPISGFKSRIILYFMVAGFLLGCLFGGCIKLDQLSKSRGG